MPFTVTGQGAGVTDAFRIGHAPYKKENLGENPFTEV